MDVTVRGSMQVDVVQAGAGPNLLLLHSLLAERSSFDRILPELASRYRVTVPNLPGYGTSAALAPPVIIEDYADWVAEMSAVLQLPPIPRCWGTAWAVLSPWRSPHGTAGCSAR